MANQLEPTGHRECDINALGPCPLPSGSLRQYFRVGYPLYMIWGGLAEQKPYPCSIKVPYADLYMTLPSSDIGTPVSLLLLQLRAFSDLLASPGCPSLEC
jgi:hypothetical protein